MEISALLSRIADGRPHSGQALAEEFGVTRAAVWKRMAKLKTMGLDIEAAAGSGYRLRDPLDLLDTDEIRARLDSAEASAVERIETFLSLDSTNRYLKDRPAPPLGRMHVCLAEYQTAGRGRRGRSWHAPLGAGLCFSAAWQFAETPPELPALTLAVGVVVRRSLLRAAGLDIDLKWPNDLVWQHRKLGGILLEMSAEAQGGCQIVAGIGLNVAMPEALLGELNDWGDGAADLRQAAGGHAPRRSALAAELIGALAQLFADYPRTGFGAYRADWLDADYLRGRRIAWHEADGRGHGTAVGVDTDGALLLDTVDGLRRRIISGDISVRAQR